MSKISENAKKIIFFGTGIGTILWFLIRVIPKPSRAAYPCMRAAAPVMSAFVIYLISLCGSVLALRKARVRFLGARYGLAALLISLSALSMLVFFGNNAVNAGAGTIAKSSFTDNPNSPMGVGKGIYPGRVSWVMDKSATNESCTNRAGDYWFMDKNTSQAVIRTMLASGLRSLTGRETGADAWDALFRNFNYAHSKGWVGYAPGEKIVVKINLTSLGNGGRKLSDGMNATPQLVLALLEQLIDTMHVAQSDLTIGDPFRGFSDDYWDKCHSKYPGVHYFEGLGTDGREQTELTTDDVFFTSDGEFQSRLPKAYMEAAYLINMPCLKSHGSAGISVAAKNHQGSVIGPYQDASSQAMGSYLHYAYPDNDDNRVMGMYRHIVDYMAHNKLGCNTLVYIVDAIWSGRDWFGAVEKWKMAPFNTDWTSSLFLSQDAVAIESVGYDFLFHEYDNYSSSHNNVVFPTWHGVQDYIHQAADPAFWPAGIIYDPDNEDHRSPVGSLGVHEHWNDAGNKQYSQNLGQNNGIELVGVPSSLANSQSIHVSSVSLPLSITITGEHKLSVSIYPEDVPNKGIIWESSDTSIATVSQDGLVKPFKNGDVIISAYSIDGNRCASCPVTVSIASGIREIDSDQTNPCFIFPNPVHDRATIRYMLREYATVHAEFYSIDGKLIMKTTEIDQASGNNSIVINTGGYALGKGIYLCRVVAKGRSTDTYTGRMMVDKN